MSRLKSMTYNQIQHTKAITSMGCESSISRALRSFVAAIFWSVPHQCPTSPVWGGGGVYAAVRARARLVWGYAVLGLVICPQKCPSLWGMVVFVAIQLFVSTCYGKYHGRIFVGGTIQNEKRGSGMKRIGFALVTVCLTGSVWADKQIIGDWVLDVRPEFSEAYTGNDSASTFGFLCGPDSCSAYLDVKSPCDENSSIPMLINAESGSAYVSAKCAHFSQAGSVRYISIIDDKHIAAAISSGAAIGFAIPLLSGEFKVVRFSLDGALRATDLAVDAAKASKVKRFEDVRL